MIKKVKEESLLNILAMSEKDRSRLLTEDLITQQADWPELDYRLVSLLGPHLDKPHSMGTVPSSVRVYWLSSCVSAF